MRHLIIISFVLLGASILGGCMIDKVKCPPDEYKTNLIDSTSKTKVTYTGFDTLIFRRTSMGDTHTFIGTGIEHGFSEQTYPLNIDCPGGHVKLENIRYNFQSATYPDLLHFMIYIPSHDDITYLQVDFGNLSNNAGAVAYSPPFLYNQLTIQNKTYTNVIFISDLGKDTSSYTAYNKDYGILKIKFRNGETWELLERK